MNCGCSTSGCSPSLSVSTPITKGPPKAVIILFGWYSAPMHVLENKYARVYQDRGCTTIIGVVHPLILIHNDAKGFDEFVKRAIKQAAVILRVNPDIPLIVHCFSNAGCRAVNHMDMMLDKCNKISSSVSATTTGNFEDVEEDEDSSINLINGNNEIDDDIALIKERLKGQIFDSAPASVPPNDRKLAHKRHQWRVSSQNSCIWVNLLAYISDSIDRKKARIESVDAPEEEYWNAVKRSTVCKNQAFLYSEADYLCDTEKIEELIENRRQQRNTDIIAKKFEDSSHVNHLATQREEYCEVIDAMLNKAGAV